MTEIEQLIDDCRAIQNRILDMRAETVEWINYLEALPDA